MNPYVFNFMPKLILGSSFEFDEHGDIFKLATIVDDPDILDKCASSKVVQEWGEIAPIKNASLIHLIALGATERTGPNRNGDGFKRAFLREAHPTFKKHGALYKDHINKEYEKRYGDVEKTAYNDDMDRAELLVSARHDKCADWLGDIERGRRVDFSMGFDCFIPSTLVRTLGGDRPISEVTLDDYVLTHAGEFKPVEAVLPSPRGDRRILQIKMQTHGEPMFPTEDHKIFAVRREAVRRPSRDRWSDHLDRMVPEWIEAGDLKEGDYMLRPVMPLIGTVDISPEIAYMLGQFIGDGCISDASDSVAITTNVADTHLLERMVRICLKLQWDFSVDYYNYDREKCRKKQATSLRIREPEFTALCRDFCGQTKDKYVRQSVWSWSRESVLHFLGGYVDADGCYDPESFHIRTSCVLDRMNESIQQLFFSVGIVATTWKDWFGLRSNGSIFSDREYSNVLFVNKSDTCKLAGYSAKVQPGESVRAQECIFFDRPEGRYLACPINKIETAPEQPDEVFCLTVADHHSFVAEGAVVHNCKYDVCSICNHKAKTRKDYCSCVKKGAKPPFGMGKILPDGRKCYVDNPDGVFNDISKVGTGADMIAQHLRKVAGFDQTEVLGGADLMDALGFRQPTVSESVKIAIAQKCSRIEKVLPVVSYSAAKSRERISTKVAEKLRSATPPILFAELAKIGTVLPFREFFRLMMGREKYAEIEPLVLAAEGRAPHHLADISDDTERLHRICSNSTYDGAKQGRYASIIDDFDAIELVREFSIMPELAHERAVRMAISGERRDEEKLAHQGDQRLDFLLDEYVAYKLAALEGTQWNLSDEVILAASMVS